MTLRMRAVVTVAVALGTASCGGGSGGSSVDASVNADVILYDQIQGGIGAEAPRSLCAVLGLKKGRAYGMATVDRLEGRSEIVASVNRGFTYATVTFTDRWDGGSLETLTVRFSGGPVEGGGTEGWQLRGLYRGETVGLLLDSATESNRSFPGLDNEGLFRAGDGGFDNGVILTRQNMDAETFSRFMKNWIGTDQCRAGNDVYPDYALPNDAGVADGRFTDGPIPLMPGTD